MVFETFTALVAFLAVAYAGLSRYLQNKLVDKSEMEAIQAESKRISAEMKTAQERKDDARVQELMKQQMDALPKMNKVMMGQFKPMIIILGVFFGLIWAIGLVDPSLKDDIAINMSDDGRGCDAAADDGIWSACYALNDSNYGKWTFTAQAYRGGGEAGANSTWFAYGGDAGDNYTEPQKGEPVAVSTDKGRYSPGETVKLYARPEKPVDSVNALLNNGTYFYVDLPMAIPILNVQRIQQAYWWFVFISFVASIGISVAFGQLQKKKDATGTGMEGAK